MGVGVRTIVRMTTAWSTIADLNSPLFSLSPLKIQEKGMSKTAHEHRENKRAQAEERQALRDARSSQEQLAVLDARFGKNKGAKKERARLTQNA